MALMDGLGKRRKTPVLPLFFSSSEKKLIDLLLLEFNDKNKQRWENYLLPNLFHKA